MIAPNYTIIYAELSCIDFKYTEDADKCPVKYMKKWSQDKE